MLLKEKMAISKESVLNDLHVLEPGGGLCLGF